MEWILTIPTTRNENGFYISIIFIHILGKKKSRLLNYLHLFNVMDFFFNIN